MRGILNPTMSSQTNQQYLDYYDSMNLSEHWRPEHYMAFQQSNDYNQFFYFFHRPKEKLKLGPFSQEENHLFFNNLITLFQTKHVTLEELKGNWGIFSLYMPFRNGLSCYSHYLSFKARYSAGNSKDLSELIKNMGSLLKNVKDPHDFCNFFINLEPGFIQTTNQQELLEKVHFLNKYLNLIIFLTFVFFEDEY